MQETKFTTGAIFKQLRFVKGPVADDQNIEIQLASHCIVQVMDNGDYGLPNKSSQAIIRIPIDITP